jgi:hypothetical protein
LKRPVEIAIARRGAKMELPVGRGSYVVKAGEGLSEIAERHGFFWRTLWEHPDNDELRGGAKNQRYCCQATA